MGGETVDYVEMVIIDYSVSRLMGGPKKTKIERAKDNNKAKYL